jgi:hypothetical protein
LGQRLCHELSLLPCKNDRRLPWERREPFLVIAGASKHKQIPTNLLQFGICAQVGESIDKAGPSQRQLRRGKKANEVSEPEA